MKKKLYATAAAALLSAAMLASACGKTASGAEDTRPSQTEAAMTEAPPTAAEETSLEEPEESAAATDASDSSSSQDASDDGSSLADLAQPVRIFGPASKEGEDLVIDNQSGVSSAGDVVLHLSENTLILDAVSGLPVEFDTIKDGETAYAYIGPAMTMSLPPQTTAEMILAGIPADFKVPDYVTVASFTAADSGYVLETTDGLTFSVAKDCPIAPYLTRQIVTLEELALGRRCLIWSDDSGNASQIVLFNE